MLYDATKEQMRLMQAEDGSFHIWKWGMGRITMDVYDASLHYRYTRKVSRNATRLFFLSFQHFYYAVVGEPKQSKVYKVRGEAYTDETAALNSLPLEHLPILHFVQGNSQLLLVQQGINDSTGQHTLVITAVDSSFQFINSVQLSTNYTAPQIRNLRVFTLGNQLLLMLTRLQDNSDKLTVHQVNVERGTVRSGTIQFDDELFTPEQVLPYGSGCIVQGYASQPLISSQRKQNAYTYLLRLDSSLKVISSFHNELEDSSTAKNTTYMYLPISTTVLPTNSLLTIDYRRAVNTKTWKYNTELRLTRLDSNLNVVQNIQQPTADYSNLPGFLFTKGKQVNVYYEEVIKNNITVVHNYQLGDTIENDRILQLEPRYRYQLRRAIPITSTSFVMPYLRNYKMGLVRVHVAEVY
jgi:hypothetical protein